MKRNKKNNKKLIKMIKIKNKNIKKVMMIQDYYKIF